MYIVSELFNILSKENRLKMGVSNFNFFTMLFQLVPLWVPISLHQNMPISSYCHHAIIIGGFLARIRAATSSRSTFHPRFLFTKVHIYWGHKSVRSKIRGKQITISKQLRRLFWLFLTLFKLFVSGLAYVLSNLMYCDKFSIQTSFQARNRFCF